MTPAEVAKVLAKASAFDQRTIGQTDVTAWHEVLSDVDFADALTAVARHYTERTERLMPAHVRRIASELERDRRRRAREQFEAQALRELESDPSRYNRSPALKALLADLRDSLPAGDPTRMRRAEWVEQDRQRARQARAEPNPHFAGLPPPGGHPMEVS